MQVNIITEAQNDLDLLDDTLYEEAYRYFELFKTDYFKNSLPLENKDGRNLRGCRKTYFANTKYRIVSKLEANEIKIINIIAVGKRDGYEVYDSAIKRLKN